jgi:hypothetical protein
MTDHETFLLLAAKEIHDGLTADESRVLEGHLAGCPSCRRFATGMRRDETRLRAALTDAPVAARVRRTVLDSAAGRRRTDARLALALVAAVVIGIVALPVLVGGGNPAPTAIASVSAAPATAGPTSSQSPAASPSGVPSTSPSASASGASRASVDGAYAYNVAPGATRRDSVSAHVEGGGPVGEWSRMTPATGGGTAFGGPVTCLVIDGPDAWLAGPATTASDGSTDRAAFLYVHDGGPGGDGDSAVLWMNDPGQTLATMEGWCTSRFIPAGPYPLDEGDVTVRAAAD